MDLLTGTWEDRIYDPEGEVIKSDIITLRQVGEEIAGTIRREYPAEQAHRKWEISGKVVGKDFIAIFWSENPEITSHGCWHLHRENDSLFTGYYMKTDAGDLLSAKPVRLDLAKKG
ncbi:MAG: hypothetical protein PVJ01_00265 [Pseudomonadota bacterium]|jgi:hypothetical protein